MTDALEDAERAHILRVLERRHWTIEGPGQAAERLGLVLSTLRKPDESPLDPPSGTVLTASGSASHVVEA